MAALIAMFGWQAPAFAERLQASGKLTLLRVHDVGTKYGPPTDQIDVEVVIKLSSAADKAFGFQLRDDNGGPVHDGMLALLRDAWTHDWTVTIDYDVDTGKKNGTVVRVWLTR
jgi:hypothetical protein